MGTPASNGRTLFLDVGAAIAAVDMATGNQIWRTVYREGSTPRIDNLVIADSQLLVADDGLVMALDANDGNVIWKRSVDSVTPLAAVSADGRAFYVGSSDHRAIAIDRRTGASLWDVDLAPDTPFRAVTLGLAVSGDTVYVNVREDLSRSGHLSRGIVTALDRMTGRKIWAYTTPDSTGDAFGAPAISDRLLVISDFSGSGFYALHRRTGDEMWRIDQRTAHFGPSTTPLLSGDTVFVGSNDTYVYAVDVNTGKLFWRAETAASIHAIAMCGSRLIVQNQDIGILDRATGKTIANTLSVDERPYDDDVLTSRFAVSGTLAFVAGYRELLAIRCR